MCGSGWRKARLAERPCRYGRATVTDDARVDDLFAPLEPAASPPSGRRRPPEGIASCGPTSVLLRCGNPEPTLTAPDLHVVMCRVMYTVTCARC